MTKAGRYLSDKKFNKKQLEIGTKEELEHTRSKKLAKGIAKDHLAEYPKYYVELQKMEKRLKVRQ